MTSVDDRVELVGFVGTVIRPGDGDYEATRQVFNAMIDRRPALIARCANPDDVAIAVRAAAGAGLSLSVYGGGHGVTGSAVCDGGLCVDLRAMKGIEVDPAAATARVEAGVTWGELDAATQAHGLAVTGGRVTTTGVGGLALGSGSGWLERKYGFTCDSLVSADVVTASGDKVVASESENPDLFWALRGGGGNFGVVTTFHFQLHPVGPIVLGGMLVHPVENATAVVRFWRDFMLDAPDEVGSGLAFICAPLADFVPEPVQGKPVIGIVICYAGDPETGAQVLAPLLEFGPPAINLVQPMPYVAVQSLLDPGNQKGMQNYWTGDFYADLSDEAVDVLVSIATEPVSPMTQIIVIAGGGAIARVDDDAMAFGHRDTRWNIHYLSMWPDAADTEKNVAYTKRLAGAMKPYSTGRVYLNFLGDEGQDRVAAGFGEAKYAKLRSIKATWDPTNLFRNNQNIPPA
jgi:FAD/FMN-containing dehydrogenase